MELKVLILFIMIMCHIIDDYYLQSILATLKQKSFWETKDEMYKYDYIIALFMHSFSWSFMIILVPTIYTYFTGNNSIVFCIILFLINLFIHAIIDDLKANRHKINLIQDQIAHLLQILFTYLMIIF